MTKNDLEILRRSAGATGQLTRDQLAWLLEACKGLVDEREHLEAIVARLSDPWQDVRRVLNDLHALLAQTETTTDEPRSAL